MTFEKVREAALKLPNVEEGTAWGFPAFRVKKKMFLCFREDLGAVLMHAPFDQRDAMIEEEPETFFSTDHHRPYPCVLARVTRLRAAVLPDLLQMAWKHAAPIKRKGKASKSKRS
jgi:hypothetical protein